MLWLLFAVSAVADPTWDRLWSASHPPALMPWFTHDEIGWNTAVADTLRPIVVDSGVYVDGPWNNRTLVRVRGSRVTGPSLLATHDVLGGGGDSIRVAGGRTFRRLDGKPFDAGVHSLITYDGDAWALQQYDGWVEIAPVLGAGLGVDNYQGSAPLVAMFPSQNRLTIKNPVQQSKPITLQITTRPHQQPVFWPSVHVPGQIFLQISNGKYYVDMPTGPGDDDNFAADVVTPTQLGDTTPPSLGAEPPAAPPPITWLTQSSDDGRTAVTASGLTLAKQDDTPFDTPHHARFFQLREQDNPLAPVLQRVLDQCMRNSDNGCLDLAALWQAGKATDVVRVAAGNGQRGQWLVQPPNKSLSWLADGDPNWKRTVAATVAAWETECFRDPDALATAPVSCKDLQTEKDNARALGLHAVTADSRSSFEPALQPWAVAVILVAAVLLIALITGVGVAKS